MQENLQDKSTIIITLEHEAFVTGKKVKELYVDVRAKEEEIALPSKPTDIPLATHTDFIYFIQELYISHWEIVK